MQFKPLLFQGQLSWFLPETSYALFGVSASLLLMLSKMPSWLICLTNSYTFLKTHTRLPRVILYRKPSLTLQDRLGAFFLLLESSVSFYHNTQYTVLLLLTKLSLQLGLVSSSLCPHLLEVFCHLWLLFLHHTGHAPNLINWQSFWFCLQQYPKSFPLLLLSL